MKHQVVYAGIANKTHERSAWWAQPHRVQGVVRALRVGCEALAIYGLQHEKPATFARMSSEKTVKELAEGYTHALLAGVEMQRVRLVV